MLFDYLYELINILWPIALACLCGFHFIYGAKGFGSTLIAGISFIVLYSIPLADGFLQAYIHPETQWQTQAVILLNILSMIGVGIREEVIFRGIIANSLAMKYATDKKGLWFAVIVSSVLFGCIHVTNLFVGVEPTGLIAQIIGSAAIGLFYTVIYLRGGNIWVPILIHAFQDSSVLFKSLFTVTTVTEVDQMSSTNLSSGFIMIGVCVALSMFLLRKSKQPAVFARLEQLRNQSGWSAEKAL
jgi:membrane protease YdiL (CAAX protease family)